MTEQLQPDQPDVLVIRRQGGSVEQLRAIGALAGTMGFGTDYYIGNQMSSNVGASASERSPFLLYARLDDFRAATQELGKRANLAVRGWDVLAKDFVEAHKLGREPLVDFVDHPPDEEEWDACRVDRLDVRTLGALVDRIKPIIDGKSAERKKVIFRNYLPPQTGEEIFKLWDQVVQKMLQ